MATFTNDTLPWKLREGKPNHSGALSSEQIQRLSKDWDIAAKHLEEMSRNIDIGLSSELNLIQPNLSQPKREKGKREAETAIKKTREYFQSNGRHQQNIEQSKFR